MPLFVGCENIFFRIAANTIRFAENKKMERTQLAQEILSLVSQPKIAAIEKDLLLEKLRKLYEVVKNDLTNDNKKTDLQTETLEEILCIEKIEPAKETMSLEQQQVATVVQKNEPLIPLKKEVLKQENIAVEQNVKTGGSLNEVFSKPITSLNQQLETLTAGLNEKLAAKDLKTLIDLNKQFVLTNELFAGNSNAFLEAVNHINQLETIEIAFAYITDKLQPQYQWKKEWQATRLFDKLVRQKFGVQ